MSKRSQMNSIDNMWISFRWCCFSHLADSPPTAIRIIVVSQSANIRPHFSWNEKCQIVRSDHDGNPPIRVQYEVKTEATQTRMV